MARSSTKQVEKLVKNIDAGLEEHARRLAALSTEYTKAAVHFSSIHCKGLKKAEKHLAYTAKHVEKLAKEFL